MRTYETDYWAYQMNRREGMVSILKNEELNNLNLECGLELPSTETLKSKAHLLDQKVNT